MDGLPAPLAAAEETLARIEVAMVHVAAERQLRDEQVALLRELDRDGVFVHPRDRELLRAALG